MYFALSWHVWSFPDFPGYTVDPLHVPVFSGLFRMFPLFSASDILSHNCSLSCCCHFRIFPLRPNHLTIVPVDGPVMAALFRSFPFFSISRFLRFGPAISKLIHFMFLPVISEPFRFGPAISHLFCFMFLSFPDFPIFSASAVSQFINPFHSGFSGLSRLFPNTRPHSFVSRSCHVRIFQILSGLVWP